MTSYKIPPAHLTSMLPYSIINIMENITHTCAKSFLAGATSIMDLSGSTHRERIRAIRAKSARGLRNDFERVGDCIRSAMSKLDEEKKIEPR